MPRLVKVFQRQRATFLVSTTERYGLFHAEVFAFFWREEAPSSRGRVKFGAGAGHPPLSSWLGD